MRCYICSYADFSGRAECIDQSEHMKGGNAVHWRKDYHAPGKGEFICNYCFSISERNRRLYLYQFGAIGEKVSFGTSMSTLISGPVEAYKRKKDIESRAEPTEGLRPEQDDKEVTSTLSEVQ